MGWASIIKQEACLHASFPRCFVGHRSCTAAKHALPFFSPSGGADRNSLVVSIAVVWFDTMKRQRLLSTCALFAFNLLVVCGFRSDANATIARQTITLDAAIDLALRSHPSEAQARAAVDVASAHVIENRSPYLPQIVGTGQYQRLTYNPTGKPGVFAPAATATTTGATPPTTSWTRTSDFFTFGGTASQLIYDFGQTSGRWSSAQASESAATHSEHAVQVQIISNVRKAYFQARAQRDLIDVAAEAVANQKMHVDQIQGLVREGMRPEIDRVTAETGLANAQVQLISAQNAYDLACAAFSQAIGQSSAARYEPGSDDMPPVADEDAPIERLLEFALHDRPELASFAKQREAQEKMVAAARGSYGPNLQAQASIAGTGVSLDNLAPNWWVGALLTWPIFQGGLTQGQVAEAQANLHAIKAQEDVFRLQVRIDVEQAALAVRAARATLGAALLARENAQKQLQLAEARYAAGMGSVIELSDAQVTRTTAAAQEVGARFSLASSRAALWGALGRR
jgi:outer membrane protein